METREPGTQRRRFAPRTSRLRIGSCIARGSRVWVRNLPAFTLLSAVVFLPIVLYTLAVLSDEPRFESLEQAQAYAWKIRLWQIITFVGLSFLPLVVTGTITYATVQDLRGKPAGFAAATGVGLTRLLPVLGVVLVMILLTAGIGLVATPFAMMAPVLGMIVLVVLVVLAMCVLWVAVPAAVIERPGVFGALRRSSELTSGAKPAILVVVLFLLGANWLLNYGIEKLIVEHAEELPDIRNAFLLQIGISAVVFGSLSSAINAVGYHDLRVSREGVNVEDLARVFA